MTEIFSTRRDHTPPAARTPSGQVSVVVVGCQDRRAVSDIAGGCARLQTDVHGHACECETSVSLANHEHLVKMAAIRGRQTRPLKRLSRLPEGAVSKEWYTDFPERYAGNANAATKAKGLKLRALVVDTLAEYVRAVKKDRVLPALTKEFHDRCDRVGR